MFDFSDYLEDSKLFDPVNKNVIGKMKDKVKGKIISELVGLKSKMYSLVIANNEEIKKEKGVNKNIVKNIRHKEYMLMFCLIKVWSDLKWKEFKVNYSESELMMFVKFLCLVLMIRGKFFMMVLVVYLIFIKISEVNKISKINEINRINKTNEIK